MRNQTTLIDRLAINPEVSAALAEGGPVVALESTLISHGLPYPQNIEVAKASEAAVRAAGAVPATVAINAGRVLVGLDDAALTALATAPAGSVRKAARPSLAAALAGGGWAATTVSATMIAAHAAGISVFATGGIGGVHHGALAGAAPASGGTSQQPTFDISSDLEELGRTPVAVVCAGPKAILDVPATLEYLETRGVPVVAVGQADLPGFYAISAGIAAPDSVPDLDAAADLVGRPTRPRSRRAGSSSAFRFRKPTLFQVTSRGRQWNVPSARPRGQASRGPSSPRGCSPASRS